MKKLYVIQKVDKNKDFKQQNEADKIHSKKKK